MATTDEQDDKTDAPPPPQPQPTKQEEPELEQDMKSEERETEDEKTPLKRPRTEPTSEEANGGSDVKDDKDEVVSEEVVVMEGEIEAETPKGRPHRERKAVERYSIASPPSRGSGSSKPLTIAKGSGTPLKEIPNVAFKLSKKKPDDNLQLLHTILFGKKAKVHTLKRDIGQFSGFVWVDNEEKHQAKIKEKLDKCVKEKLLDFCDVLNIPINKTLVKKEDLSVKLLEFLKSPHATTEELLADKEQKVKKQKSKGTPARSRSSKGSSGEKSEKTQAGEKQKTSTKPKKENRAAVGDDDDVDRQSHSSEEDEEAEKKEESDKEETKSDEEEDKVEEKKTSSKSTSKRSSGVKSGKKTTNINKSIPEESSKSPTKSVVKKATGTKRSKSDAEASASPSKTKGSSGKRQKVNEESSKGKPVEAEDKPAKKQATKSSSKSASGKGKAGQETKAEPTTDELRDEAAKILNEVDFNSATLSDILRLLGTHFGLDLMHRRLEVKDIITEIIQNMSNDNDDDDGSDDDGDEEDSGKK